MLKPYYVDLVEEPIAAVREAIGPQVDIILEPLVHRCCLGHPDWPDVGTYGGITEGKEIADMAATYDVGVQIHLCASPLCTAAALQLECVMPNFASTSSICPRDRARGDGDRRRRVAALKILRPSILRPPDTVNAVRSSASLH